MRAIDTAFLLVLAPEGDKALIATLAPVLAQALPAAGLDPAQLPKPFRVAHFLGQAVYETGYLTKLVENLDYSAVRIPQVWPHLAARAGGLAHNPEALANAAYAGENGNDNEAGGDGWRFRGRGLLQITGRYWYGQLGPTVGHDLLANPDYAATPEGAVASALAFWNIGNVNDAADADDITRVTRRVNGGTEGLAERCFIKCRALKMIEA